MDIKDIILFILVIVIIYLIYKTRNIENFNSSTLNQNIINSVNDRYKSDIDAMINLASISSNIMNNNNTLTLPATTTTANKLTVSGDLSGAQNLVIGGNVIFSNKDDNIMEIFPTGMILAWLRGEQPKGWALCDGNYYKLNSSGDALVDLTKTGQSTPDLRSKFIISAHGSTENGTFFDKYQEILLTNRPYGSYGGKDTHTLEEGEMPTHFHYEFVNQTNYTIGSVVGTDTSPISSLIKGDNSHNYIMQSAGLSSTPRVGRTDERGSSEPHNNIPPYFSLFYYMKL
jgi:microcystin-dependent protein